MSEEYMSGDLACVSVNHVISIRIVTSGDAWIIQALTTDWAIDLERSVNFEAAQMIMNDLAMKLRHQ